MPKIITYNVNGIRAAITKGWIDWVKSVDPDIILLQEIKAEQHQVDITELEKVGYHHYWHSAEKKGYSGVALFSKIKPDKVTIGSGDASIDREGRIIRADYGDVSVMGVYIPSGSSGEDRQGYKMEWLGWFDTYLDELRETRKKLIIGGDVNICHKPIDIHNPISNAKSSGFLPEERAWVDRLIERGYIDSFRHFNQEPHNYSWWTFRAGAREKNLGWRIDYLFVTENLKSNLKSAAILADVKHSDHCPVVLEVDF
jgi:exodeoxyribonuclease-3